jgi:hypothetical protein
MKNKIETERPVQILSSSKLIIQKSRREENMLRVFRTLLFLIAIISLLVTSLSCHRTPIEPEKIKANLIYEDALCTEAYLRLKLAYIDFPANVDLYVDKNKVNSFRTFSEDTVIMVENLLPKKSYTSYVRIYPTGGGEIVSNEVSFTTMDTTSHNFTWQIFEFGNFGNSAFFDVAIINDNDIWAVGEIYVADTNINGYTMYNAVHWDGNKWELKQILYKNGFWPIRAVYAFNSNDIWFSGYMRYYNGRFIELSIPDILIGWGIDKIWGTSSNDIYAVGDYGNIAHWDGKRWTKIESGTDVDFKSIAKGLDEEVYVSGSSSNNRYHILLKINKDKNVEVQPIPPGSEGIYFVSSAKEILFLSGIVGVYWKHLKYDKSYTFISRLNYATYGMKSDNYNNLFLVTALSKIFHFNGINLMSLNHPLSGELAILRSVDVKNDFVVVVGERIQNMFSGTAVILIGKRNK